MKTLILILSFVICLDYTQAQVVGGTGGGVVTRDPKGLIIKIEVDGKVLAESNLASLRKTDEKVQDLLKYASARFANHKFKTIEEFQLYLITMKAVSIGTTVIPSSYCPTCVGQEDLPKINADTLDHFMNRKMKRLMRHLVEDPNCLSYFRMVENMDIPTSIIVNRYLTELAND